MGRLRKSGGLGANFALQNDRKAGFLSLNELPEEANNLYLGAEQTKKFCDASGTEVASKTIGDNNCKS